ncbi:hypothetical protein ANCDUO_16760, partial [Ancylostoma duodenale]
MLYGRIMQFGRILSAIHTSKARLHSSVLLNSIGRYAKLQKRKDPLAAYPPEFRAKLRDWPRLLQAEIDESVNHLKELRALSDLRELEDRGAPVAIREAKSLKEIAECVMLASNRKEITIKVRPSSSSRSLNGDTEYILTLSQSSGALHSVQDFFLQNKVVDTPGVDLLGYAFRAKNMPSIHNDRMITDLPDELNESQRRAVSAALNKRRPFVTIQGPPGTGKTRVVAEIVRQLYKKKLKTLVCAPSHVAVDKVMSELVKFFDNATSEEDLPTSSEESDVIADAETIEDAISSHEKYSDLCDLFDKM